MTIHVLYCCRSVVTAGHCICGKSTISGPPGPDMECREDPTNKNDAQNQVTKFPAFSNQIYVLAGSKKSSEVTRDNNFVMKKAFVKFDESKPPDMYYDIGVVTLPTTLDGESTTFYSTKFDRIFKAQMLQVNFFSL